MGSAALRLLADSALAARLAAAARADVLARFTWQAVQQEWVRLYRSLARPGETPQ
jgi:glycosyltransferase involved in cell wall biosynthesis